METIKVDVAVIGAGAGGFGTVYRLAKNKKTVAVVDRLNDFGGTAVFGGVNCWEPGVSGAGVHRKIAALLLKNGDGAVCKFVPNININALNKNGEYDTDWSKDRRDIRPFVVSAPFKKEKYRFTEKRCYITNDGGRYYRRFVFKPDAMSFAMNNVLESYDGHVKRFFNSEYVSFKRDGNKIKSVVVSCLGKEYEIVADYFVDGTGDVIFSRDVGVPVSLGTDGKSDYNEPSCSDERGTGINGVSLLFTVAKTDDPNYITKIPDKYKDIDLSFWKKNVLEKNECIGFFNVYPDMSININMLPTMDGSEYLALKEKGMEVCRARVYAYWQWLQTEKGLKGYDIVKIADVVGERESYRIKGEYILTENDIRKGYLNQDKREEFIAYSDHCLDVHGENALSVELDTPFGIPLSCTMTNEYDNLFVVSKGISLSHIASSSCRLTRTLMTVGEGVGETVSQLIDGGKIDFKKLRKTLKLDRYERSLAYKRSQYSERLKT